MLASGGLWFSVVVWLACRCFAVAILAGCGIEPFPVRLTPLALIICFVGLFDGWVDASGFADVGYLREIKPHVDVQAVHSLRGSKSVPDTEHSALPHECQFDRAMARSTLPDIYRAPGHRHSYIRWR